MWQTWDRLISQTEAVPEAKAVVLGYVPRAAGVAVLCESPGTGKAEGGCWQCHSRCPVEHQAVCKVLRLQPGQRGVDGVSG